MARCARCVNKSSLTAVSPELTAVLRHRFIALLAATIVVCAFAQSGGRVQTPAPVKDYTVSFFSDEGYPHVRVQGASADLRDPTHVKLGDMILTVFTGQADREIETVLIAPTAIVEPEPEIVAGPDTVRLERSDLYLTGEDWSYEHRERRVHIRRNARIVFNAPIADLLK